jgi:endosialidase-like protein
MHTKLHSIERHFPEEESNMNKPTVSTALWVAFSCLLCIPAFGGDTPSPNSIAEVRIGPNRVDWVPAVDAERWILTVSGPGDFFLRRQFEAGKPPFLSVFDSEGDRLPNGSYAWELQGIQEREAGTPEPPSRPRETGKVLKTPRAPELELSGRFSIQEGSFVATPPNAGAEPPESPLHNVDAKLLSHGPFANEGNACIGDECHSESDANFSALKLRSTLPHLYFDDVELPCEGCSTGNPHDWAVLINQSNTDQFAISELLDGTLLSTPLTVRGGAPNNSLFVNTNGNVGVGTSTPGAHFEVSGGEVRFPAGSNLGGFTHFNYAGDKNNYIRGITIMADNGGWVGIGTATPITKLHVSGDSVPWTAPTKILVQETSTTTTPRELLEIQNNGAVVFILKDISVPERWGIGTLGSSLVLDNQARTGLEAFLSNTGNLTIAGILTQGSSRDLKTDFVSLDPQNVLSRVASLPVSLWSYKTEAGVRHVGPMAEDFHALFGLGEDDKHLAPGDQAGVALLAVQGLNQKLREKDSEIAELKGRIERLERMVQIQSQEKAQSEPQQ